MAAAAPSTTAAGRVLGVFAKRPTSGAVKTRLAAAASPAWAGQVAEAFLLDVLDRLADVPARRVLAFAPADAEGYFAEVAAGRFTLVAQGDGDLGVRTARFFTGQLPAAPAGVVLVGTDSPTMPVAYVGQTFAELRRADVVLGPATDGGYYLIGCARRVPPVFDGVPWSTPEVLAATVARLEDVPGRLAVLPPWYDVDTWDDWQTLCGHLRALRRAGLDPGVPRTERLALAPTPRARA